MKKYIYWPNGILEIRLDGRTVHRGHPTAGESLYGLPGSRDEIEYPLWQHEGQWQHYPTVAERFPVGN